jgi:twitching motility two-component system response regulator PilG
MAKSRILIIEDEESLLRLLTILLTSRGYRVIGVQEGSAGLAEMERTSFDLVLLDLMLPGLDGFEVCRSIKENPETRHIPVVILTARKGSADLERGLGLGADAYITKPFKSSRVMETVAELLARGTSHP